jgi:UDP-glucose 4-epimerase
MIILITGVAGFIGSNLAKFFLAQGRRVIGLDNLSNGRLDNIRSLRSNSNFLFVEAELSDLKKYKDALTYFRGGETITEVWHMAANSDISAAVHYASVDLRDTLMTTFNTLEIMRELNIGVIVFASSSAIYGDLNETKLSEDIGPLLPVSNYGAMKLAAEAIISAAAESFLEKAYIFRFPNVIGIPATHGVILDFVRKLKATPDSLAVLGDGTQTKNYLHVDELIEAMFYIVEKSSDKRNVFNIGADDEGVTVQFIAEQVVTTVAPDALIRYGQGNKGWVGDIPKFSYSVDKLKNMGWRPKMNSAQAVVLAVKQIAEQERFA